MSLRYTNTEKWNDSWFASLKPLEKLLFIFLCDNCNIAGFIEINIKIWAINLGCYPKNIEGGLKGVQRGIIRSVDGDCLYIRNFLKHQKNYPFNEKNKAHIAIIKLFNEYSYKFNIEDITKFIEGGSKGVTTPTGNGNGNGNGNGKKEGSGGKNEINISFKTFWNLYDKKVDMGKCGPKWNRLTDIERLNCIDKLPDYIKATPDKKFRRDPETYLNNKSWENEIIKPNAKSETLTYDEILKISETNPDIWKSYEAVKREGERKAVFELIKSE
ncbi:MAG TPA: hypothetical protein VMV77_04655 [Bacteroidales bacterium]|nr:hypothetical protein [Bacteroidales bacterium]